MKKLTFVLGIATFAFLTGCSSDNGISDGDTICGITTKRIYAEDVYGTLQSRVRSRNRLYRLSELHWNHGNKGRNLH